MRTACDRWLSPRDGSPQLRNDDIILDAHTDGEVAAHLASEDKETARRFG